MSGEPTDLKLDHVVVDHEAEVHAGRHAVDQTGAHERGLFRIGLALVDEAAGDDHSGDCVVGAAHSTSA
jgi:hypothetical protein